MSCNELRKSTCKKTFKVLKNAVLAKQLVIITAFGVITEDHFVRSATRATLGLFCFPLRTNIRRLGRAGLYYFQGIFQGTTGKWVIKVYDYVVIPYFLYYYGVRALLYLCDA